MAVAKEARGGRSSSPVVLIVEDDILLRITTGSYLRDEGFDVIEAAHANEAICVLEHLPVDAVFADIEMPGGLNGLALGHWLRKKKPTVGFLLTSGIEPPPAEAGEWSLLSKPYEPSELTDRLRSLLGRQQWRL